MPVIRAALEEYYAFACFRLFPKQRMLLCDDKPVAIGARTFDLLVQLVSQAGKVVTAAELMESVWPNITVEEANLRVQIGQLRKILAQYEEARRVIDTITLRGYCFILPVRYFAADAAEDTSSSATAYAKLPLLLNPIIGREDAIAIIAAALGERQLVSIIGPGGVGKTTVAVATAARYAAGFHGRAILVDLSRVSDESGAAVAIAEALKLPSQRDALTALCDYLRFHDLLIILDTCEHITGPITRLVETLLAHCANLKLLVTSQKALCTAGEWIYRLSSLVVPDEKAEITETSMLDYPAIAMFVDRIQAFVRFELKDRDLPVITQICRRLDGLPLALEFAATRVADLGLHQVAAQLDDRFAILNQGRRKALPRHRTLFATFDRSFGLLSDDEKRLLQQLAKRGNSFSAKHAIAAGGDAGCERPLESLDSLYEKSVLAIDMKDNAPIYRLGDSMRAYVAGTAIA